MLVRTVSYTRSGKRAACTAVGHARFTAAQRRTVATISRSLDIASSRRTVATARRPRYRMSEAVNVKVSSFLNSVSSRPR
jgi:hypothetical protein